MKATFSLISKTAPAVFAIAALLLSVPAKGDIVLSMESVTGAPGSSGAFDVLLTNTGTSSQNIAAFNFELTTADTNITFTDVTTDTTNAPYIFPDSFFGPDITTFAIDQSVEAGDVDATFNGTDVAPGATYGLGSVAFSIAPGAVNGEVAEVDFSAYPATSLSDNDGNNVDFTAESGTITVLTSTAVPEPSTVLLLAAGLLGIAALRKHRRTA
jgi:PEP-CTERM motif